MNLKNPPKRQYHTTKYVVWAWKFQSAYPAKVDGSNNKQYADWLAQALDNSKQYAKVLVDTVKG